MLSLNAADTIKLDGVLRDTAKRIKLGTFFKTPNWEPTLERMVGDCHAVAMNLHLVALRKRAEAAAAALKNSNATRSRWDRKLVALADILKEELVGRDFHYVPCNRHEFLTELEPFGERVATSFPSARRDIQEAGRCLAFGLYTACAFHLMRALEAPFAALAHSIGATIGQDWQDTGRNIQVALRQRAKSARGIESKNGFYATASAHFQELHVGDRNPINHAGELYSEREVLVLWNTSKTFMQQLATKLGEKPAVEDAHVDAPIPRRARTGSAAERSQSERVSSA